MRFEVLVVENVHVILQHCCFAEEVAQFGFVQLAGGGHAEVPGVETVAKGILVAGLRTALAF